MHSFLNLQYSTGVYGAHIYCRSVEWKTLTSIYNKEKPFTLSVFKKNITNT